MLVTGHLGRCLVSASLSPMRDFLLCFYQDAAESKRAISTILSLAALGACPSMGPLAPAERTVPGQTKVVAILRANLRKGLKALPLFIFISAFSDAEKFITRHWM